MTIGQNRILRAAAMAVALLLLFAFMLRKFEHSQVYFPGRTFDSTGAELARPFEDARFSASDGTQLHGWYYPSATNSPREHLVVLYCHGNAGNISHRLDACQALLETGVAVFLFDYRGYGRSRGKPSEEGTYLDAQAAHRWLVDKGYVAHDVIAYGESLGGGVAAELALREPLAGLILQSTFTSIPDIGAELFPWLPVRWISTIKYDTRAKLPRIKVPVLVLHSPSDELVRYRHGQENFAAANQPKLLWDLAGGHNEPLEDKGKYVAGIRRFLELVETKNSPPEK